MKRFVDVGSYDGPTIEEVVKPGWGFDAIDAIEPMPTQVEILKERFGDDPRVRIFPIALSDLTGLITMYGSNEQLEASLFGEKVDVDDHVQTRVPAFRATEWFDRFVPEADEVYVNMNCEGAEVPILWDLILTGKIHRITALLVDFDCRKVPGMEPQQYRIRDALAATMFDRYSTEYGEGTHQEQIARWLHGVVGR